MERLILQIQKGLNAERMLKAVSAGLVSPDRLADLNLLELNNDIISGRTAQKEAYERLPSITRKWTRIVSRKCGKNLEDYEVTEISDRFISDFYQFIKLYDATKGTFATFAWSSLRKYIADYTCNSKKRIAERNMVSLDEIDCMEIPAEQLTNPEYVILIKEAQQIVNRIIRSLPEQERRVFILHHSRRMTFSAISVKENLTLKQVTYRYNKAKKMFIERGHREGLEEYMAL